MADRYWVGTTADWHTSANWSATSGGAGGAGVPTSSDNVIFDSNGQAVVLANTAIACNWLAFYFDSSHIILILYQGGILYGGFYQGYGFFAPAGGGGYILDIQGDLWFFGGTFSVGTGSGVDPTVKLSGATNSLYNGTVTSIAFQSLTVSGNYTFYQTASTIICVIQQIFSVTGTLTIDTGNEVHLSGVNATFGTFTGTLTGGGKFVYTYRDDSTIATTGTIECADFQFKGKTGSASETVDEDLLVSSWLNINNDWTHTGTSPWIHDDDGDTNYISIANDATINSYDEHYNIDNLDSKYTSFTPSSIKVKLKGRLVDGAGGHPNLIGITIKVWDGSAWQSGGICYFFSTSYAVYSGSEIGGFIDTLAKVNSLRIRLELTLVIGGAADKGGINITQCWIDTTGTGYYNPVFSIAARTWETGTIEFLYTDDYQTYQFGSGRHTFNSDVDIEENNATITEATFDLATYNAEFTSTGSFEVSPNYSFPVATFTWLLGDGTHVFRGTFKLHFCYTAGTNAELVVNAGQGTLIFWPLVPSGIRVKQTQYRLSRVHNTPGFDYQTYNKVMLFNKFDEIGRGRFIEGFGASELIVNGTDLGQWYFRRVVSSPVMFYEVDKLVIVGHYENAGPLLRGQVYFSALEFRLDLTGDCDVFNCRLSYCEAKEDDIITYNSTITGGVDVIQYDRDIRVVGSQRNRLINKKIIAKRPPNAVSYTHLTLPTNREV